MAIMAIIVVPRLLFVDQVVYLPNDKYPIPYLVYLKYRWVVPIFVGARMLLGASKEANAQKVSMPNGHLRGKNEVARRIDTSLIRRDKPQLLEQLSIPCSE